MTGRANTPPIRRLRAIGRTIFALGAALILVAALAPFATAQDNPETECAGLVFLAKFNSDFVLSQGDGTGISFSNIVNKDGTTEAIGFTWTSSVVPIDRVIAKAGEDSTVKNYDEAMGPEVVLTPGDHEISHVTFCYDRDPPPDLEADPAIAKTGPVGDVQLGASYSFTLSITNDGDDGSNTGLFTVSDTVPAGAGAVTGVSDDSAAADCGNVGNVVTCSVPDLGGEDTVTVTVNVTAPSGNDDCGTVTNIASLATAGDNTSTGNDSSSDDVTITGCETIIVEVPNPSVDVEKLVSLDGTSYDDADSAPGPGFQLGLDDPAQDVWVRVVVTNTSDDGTVLTLNSLTDDVTAGDAGELDLTGCTFPAGGLPDGESVTCDLGPFDAEEGAQHTNTVTVSASGGDQTVGDSDPANYAGTRVGGVVINRPPAPAPPPAPDVVAEPDPEPDPEPAPEPAPEVLGEELPRTGPEDLWLAGFALMLIGGGLLMLGRGRAMDVPAFTAGTWWTHHLP